MNRRHGVHVILGALTPAYDGYDAETLTYPYLRSALKTQNMPSFLMRHSSELWRRRLKFSPAMIQEDWQSTYLLNAAYRLQKAWSVPEKVFWSTQFTTTSVKLFGRPLAREVASIAAHELEFFEEVVRDYEIDEEFAAPVLDAYRSLTSKRAKPLPPLEDRYADLLEKIRGIVARQYGDCFKVFEPYAPNVPLHPTEVACVFLAALNVLRVSDPMWSGWTVVMNRSAKLSVNVARKKIVVGKRRAPLLIGDIRGLFAHEVLVHAKRAVHGKTRAPELALGLPDYIAAEEGLGVLIESAMNGSVPAKVKDRYVDIALALGDWRRMPMTRNDMFTFCFSRSVLRSIALDEPVDVDLLEKVTWEHVNRIYRGGLGNKYVAVFTKDVAYYRGFIKIANYLRRAAKKDRLEKSLTYVYQGKFDPTNQNHRKFVADCGKK